jgi:hypothetical protein
MELQLFTKLEHRFASKVYICRESGGLKETTGPC